MRFCPRIANRIRASPGMVTRLNRRALYPHPRFGLPHRRMITGNGTLGLQLAKKRPISSPVAALDISKTGAFCRARHLALTIVSSPVGRAPLPFLYSGRGARGRPGSTPPPQKMPCKTLLHALPRADDFGGGGQVFGGHSGDEGDGDDGDPVGCFHVLSVHFELARFLPCWENPLTELCPIPSPNYALSTYRRAGGPNGALKSAPAAFARPLSFIFQRLGV